MVMVSPTALNALSAPLAVSSASAALMGMSSETSPVESYKEAVIPPTKRHHTASSGEDRRAPQPEHAE
jgi:hypothetical protein